MAKRTRVNRSTIRPGLQGRVQARFAGPVAGLVRRPSSQARFAGPVRRPDSQARFAGFSLQSRAGLDERRDEMFGENLALAPTAP